MNTRILILFALLASLSVLPQAFAQSAGTAGTEIDYLLDFVETSGCEFYRNGTWYDSVRAQEHLRDKYNYLSGINRIQTTEEFIERAASKSTLSGQAYEVRCGPCATTQALAEWLQSVLARYRNLVAREFES